MTGIFGGKQTIAFLPEGKSDDRKRPKQIKDCTTTELGPLKDERMVIADKLKKARKFLADMKKKLTTFRSVRKRSSESLESQLMKVLKTIGVELQRYHGGSLNGKDIKKVMDNAALVFDRFTKILKAGREDCSVSQEEIETVCLQYKSVFLLWDGAFSYARKVDPTDEDIEMCRRFVVSAVHAHDAIKCSITHKAHLMWRHVCWQMKELQADGGLGDKLEDWVERAHQTGAQNRKRWASTIDRDVRATSRSKIEARDSNPNVVAHKAGVDERAKRNFNEEAIKVKVSAQEIRKKQRTKNRMEALLAYEAKYEEELKDMAAEKVQLCGQGECEGECDV